MYFFQDYTSIFFNAMLTDYVSILDPNIEEVVIFDKMASDRKPISYSNKQLIAREIEMEKMRRFESHVKKNGEAVNSVPNEKKTENKKQVKEQNKSEASALKKNEQAPLPNHLQTLQFKAVKSSVKSSKVSSYLIQTIFLL